MTRSGLGLPSAAVYRGRAHAPGGAQAAALIARMSPAASAPRSGQIFTLVAALVAAGVWQKLDALYLLAAHSAQAARLNWIADQYNLTAVNSPTFTADRGYQGNGTSSYLDTGFVPAVAGGRFAQNSAAMGLWSRTDSLGLYGDMGQNTAHAAIIACRYTSPSDNTFRAIANTVSGGGGLSDSVCTNSLGFFAWSRTGAAVGQKYINGAPSATIVSASTGLGNLPVFVGAINSSGAPVQLSPRHYAAVFIGGGLTPGENAALYSALLAYLTAVGAA